MAEAMDVEEEPLDLSSMDYRALQKASKERGLPAKGNTAVLKMNLHDYMKDPEGTLEKIGKAKKKKKTSDWIDWRNHAAREILMEDLEQNGWLCGKDEEARTVYDIYMERQEEFFKEVPFDQFELRYNEAIKKAVKRRARAAKEEEWLKHDRLLHPRKSHNARGEPVFDLDTEAKEQLKEDIENKLHKEMSPMALWESRSLYMKYREDIFRQRIYQEIRRKKFLNWLEKKRTKKRKELKEKNIKFARKTAKKTKKN